MIRYIGRKKEKKRDFFSKIALQEGKRAVVF
jgi:hypothetical protein